MERIADTVRGFEYFDTIRNVCGILAITQHRNPRGVILTQGLQ